MKAYRGNGGKYVNILNLDTECRWTDGTDDPYNRNGHVDEGKDPCFCREVYSQ
jgi:hypothetical protein